MMTRNRLKSCYPQVLLESYTFGKVFKNVEIEPRLQLLDNKRFSLRSDITSPEARLDIKVEGFSLRRAALFY